MCGVPATCIYAPLALGHVIYALGLMAGTGDVERGRNLRARASLLLGLSGFTAIIFAADDVLESYSAHALLGPGFAVLAAFLVPFLASALERSVRRGWVHALAAQPGWVGATLFGLVTIFLGPNPFGWLVLAPVVLIALIPFDTRIAEEPTLSFVASAPAPVRVALPPPPAAGIELESVRNAEAHCPVCRETVITRARLCERCHTPHHADCFEFNGRCAIYGCA